MSGVAVTVLGVTLVFFQNCGEGLKAQKFDTGASEKVTTYLASVSAQLEPGQNVVIGLTSDDLVGSELYTWSHKFNGLASACLEQNGNHATTYIVNCPGNGDLQVELNLSDGIKGRDIDPVVIGIAAAPQALPMGNEIQMTLEFEIPSGTGVMPWNSAVAPVEAFIGQVLRIKNSDAFGHQLHTNGRPCVSTQVIDPGSYGNCLIKHSYSRAANGGIYDEGSGPQGAFYAVAHDGVQLYAQHCASCHGALGTSAKLNRKASEILAARGFEPMMQTPAILALTQRQIEAISYVLGGR